MCHVECIALNSKLLEDFLDFRYKALKTSPKEFTSEASSWKNISNKDAQLVLDESLSFRNLIVLALSKDEIVGMVGAKRELNSMVKHKVTLWGLFVDETYRNDGVAGKLINSLIELLQKRDDSVRQIRLVVNATNLAAHHLFEKHGFKAYGTEPKARKIGNNFIDQTYFLKFI